MLMILLMDLKLTSLINSHSKPPDHAILVLQYDFETTPEHVENQNQNETVRHKQHRKVKS